MYHFRQSSPVTSPSLRRFTSRSALNNPGASTNWILRLAVRSGTGIITHKSPSKLYQEVLIKIRNTKGTITDLRLLCCQTRRGLKSTQSLATEEDSFGLMVVDLFFFLATFKRKDLCEQVGHNSALKAIKVTIFVRKLNK